MKQQSHILVIGAGIGGLTAAALLIKAGHDVTVLEAQAYPGGCAGTFYHQKYLFDAGATLAGGFSPGGPHARVAEILDLKWPVKPADPAWEVHLPDNRTITQWADRERWREEWRSNFPGTGKFWQMQEMLANISWDIASRPFPWPPMTARDLVTLARNVRASSLPALPYLFRKINDLTPAGDPMFEVFLNGQLLISAQTIAAHADALYGSAALDLPRRGVNYVQGGIGSLAKVLAKWIQNHGGQILYRQQVDRIDVKKGRVTGICTTRGLSLDADAILANVTPSSLVSLLGDAAPRAFRQHIVNQPATWGAFTLYLGLDNKKLPERSSSHHQVIVDAFQPLGEGNSVFISLADPGDGTRALEGNRPATLSTHTTVSKWWEIYHRDRQAYFELRSDYTERLITAAERAIPGIREAIDISLPGTPVTFESFTGRSRGMVGGFPQTSIWNARGPRTPIDYLWLVGDSVFPGQSTAGVTLSALRVAADVIHTLSPRVFSRPLPIMRSAVGE